MNKIFHVLSIFIIVLAVIASGFGLFYTSNGQTFDFINQYGDTIKIHGDGIYKNDSLFMASIFRGTDFAVFFIIIPIAIVLLILDIKKNTLKSKLLLTSMVAFFLYYSANLSFGVVYNILFLVYMVFFGVSFFALIMGFNLLKYYSINKSSIILTNGLKIYLVFVGLSLFIAWLPDVISSLINNRSLELIDVYTTNVTYILDMGIISPLIFICLYNLSKKNDIGYILLGLNMTLLLIIAIILPVQTFFQISAGIHLPLEVIITKVGIFVILAIVAIYYEVKLFRII
jgi:hypothetical protein